MDQKDYLLGGSKKAKFELTRDFTDPNEEEKQKKEEETKEKKVKLVMKVSFRFLFFFRRFAELSFFKGRSAVDPACGQKIVDKYHVLDNGDTEIYNVMLNLTDISKGKCRRNFK